MNRKAINCTVTDTFKIKCVNSTVQVNQEVLILGSDTSSNYSCFDHVTPGKKYIIAGNFIQREHCGDTLYLASRYYIGKKECTSRPIVAESENYKTKMKFAECKSCPTSENCKAIKSL